MCSYQHCSTSPLYGDKPPSARFALAAAASPLAPLSAFLQRACSSRVFFVVSCVLHLACQCEDRVSLTIPTERSPPLYRLGTRRLVVFGVVMPLRFRNFTPYAFATSLHTIFASFALLKGCTQNFIRFRRSGSQICAARSMRVAI